MNKIKVFNSYFNSFAGSGFHTTETDDEYYSYAIERLTRGLSKEATLDSITDEVQEITFWAFYHYGKYTFQKEEPILDVEIEQLPINMTTDEFNCFKEAIEIVVEHYQNICSELGKISPINMNQFNDLFVRTERFTMKIPLVWLNT